MAEKPTPEPAETCATNGCDNPCDSAHPDCKRCRSAKKGYEEKYGIAI